MAFLDKTGLEYLWLQIINKIEKSIVVPAPTSTEEGMVLRVVDGTATWVNLPSASGESS